MSRDETPVARLRRPRSSVTPQEIVDAAELVARDGFDALTIRAVAHRMEASPMSLYRYFPTKDQLIDAMLNRVLGRIRFEPDTADWRADLASFARAHRAVLVDHPWAIVPLFTHSNPGVNAAVIGETALRILRRGGITGIQSVSVLFAILAMNYGWLAFSSARDAARSGLDAEASVSDALHALPPGEFSMTLSVADELSRYGSDAQYELALGQLIAGVGTRQ